MSWLSYVGQGMQMEGQYQQGIEAERAGKEEKAYAEKRAEILDRMAKEKREETALDATRLRRAGQRLAGSQKVSYAKAGVTFEGSPMAVMERTAAEVELDALLKIRRGQSDSDMLNWQAKTERIKGRSALARGRRARNEALLSTIGSGLQMGGGIAGASKGGGGVKNTQVGAPRGSYQGKSYA